MGFLKLQRDVYKRQVMGVAVIGTAIALLVFFHAGKGNGNPADVLLTLLDNLGFTDNYIECMLSLIHIFILGVVLSVLHLIA